MAAFARTSRVYLPSAAYTSVEQALTRAQEGEHVILARESDPAPFGILLSIGEYALLKSAAALASDPLKLIEKLRMAETLLRPENSEDVYQRDLIFRDSYDQNVLDG